MKKEVNIRDFIVVASLDFDVFRNRFQRTGTKKVSSGTKTTFLSLSVGN